MFDTYTCVIGTALNRPEKRLIASTDAIVASFRVATHPRRFDPKTMQWTDAANLRIKVNCWRRLAEHVATSILPGDPVVVWGRLCTRTWKTDTGEERSSYELEADAVGHDLARGTSEFRKSRAEAPTIVVEDADSENRVNGERTLRVGQPGDPTPSPSYDESPGYPDSFNSTSAPVSDLDAMTILREAGLEPATSDAEGGDDEDDAGEEELSGAASGSGGTVGRSRRRGRQPVSA